MLIAVFRNLINEHLIGDRYLGIDARSRAEKYEKDEIDPAHGF
jgi:hypothetical protein